MSVRHVEIAVQEEELEYMVIGGSEPKEVLSNYTALTGRTPIPPCLDLRPVALHKLDAGFRRADHTGYH